MKIRSALNTVITALKNKEIGTAIRVDDLGVSAKLMREFQEAVPAACLDYSGGVVALRFRPQRNGSTTSCQLAQCERIGSHCGSGCTYGEKYEAETYMPDVSFQEFPRASSKNPVPPKRRPS